MSQINGCGGPWAWVNGTQFDLHQKPKLQKLPKRYPKLIAGVTDVLTFGEHLL